MRNLLYIGITIGMLGCTTPKQEKSIPEIPEHVPSKVFVDKEVGIDYTLYRAASPIKSLRRDHQERREGVYIGTHDIFIEDLGADGTADIIRFPKAEMYKRGDKGTKDLFMKASEYLAKTKQEFNAK